MDSTIVKAWARKCKLQCGGRLTIRQLVQEMVMGLLSGRANQGMV